MLRGKTFYRKEKSNTWFQKKNTPTVVKIPTQKRSLNAKIEILFIVYLSNELAEVVRLSDGKNELMQFSGFHVHLRESFGVIYPLSAVGER